VKKIARIVDRLACILPFEPALYRGLDIDAEYVGNPLTDEAVVERDRETFLRAVGLDPDRPVVGLFPGSRHTELRYNFSTILAAAELIRTRLPQVQFLLPVAPTLGRENLLAHLGNSNLPVLLSDENIYDLAHACNAVIAVSGTVTLQTALVGTPMAIFYRVAPLTYAIGRRLIKVPYIGLANIVAESMVVPEFIQDQATPEAISAEILHLLTDADYDRQVRSGLQQVRARIGPPGCARRVAEMASEMSRGIVRKEKTT
jgi:lipid-A-disaccharide synthase